MSQPYVPAFEDQPRAEDISAIRSGLEAYNRQFAPDGRFKPLVIVLRAADQSIAGGLVGGTYWAWLVVEILWLDARARGQGLGARLMAMAEQEAQRRGCRGAHLDTMSFQALPFYERLGYTVFGVLEDLPPGHTAGIFSRRSSRWSPEKRRLRRLRPEETP